MKIQLKSMLSAVICGLVLLFGAASVFSLAINETSEVLSVDDAAADESGLSVTVDGDTTVRETILTAPKLSWMRQLKSLVAARISHWDLALNTA